MNRYSDIARELTRAGLEQRSPILAGGSEDLLNLLNNLYPEREMPIKFETAMTQMRLCGSEVAIPVSGGLDSMTLYYRAKEQFGSRVRAFYVDIGQPYRDKEIQAIEELKIEYEYIVADQFSQSKYWDHIIPGRNFYIFSLIAEKIRGGHIFFGVTKGEMPDVGGDKSKQFLNSVNTLFCKLPYPVSIETPLINETKVDIVRWWKEEGLLWEIGRTISCFSEEDGHCASHPRKTRSDHGFVSGSCGRG